jgi:conserved oligomeric Golgi complex subunit 6
MEFAYDVDTFDNESKRREKGNASNEGEGLGVSLKLSSLTTSDFTKKLQSLSLIGGYSNKLNGDSTNETNKQLMSLNAKANKRARISIELLDSIGFNYNPVSGKTTNGLENTDTFNRTDAFLYTSCQDGKDTVDKLTRVLESHDGYDSSIRHSLTILERRIEYEISLDKSNSSEQAITESLKHLTEVGQQGSLARRNLRGLIEDDLLHQYSAQLRNFNKIVKLVETVRPNLSTITNEYNDLCKKLENNIDISKNLKDSISSLNEQKRVINLKKNILLAFKSTFTISQYEGHLIRFAPLDDPTTTADFFKAVEKIKSIQGNCEVLLGMENEKLGLSIMKQMNELLISVNDKISSYIQKNVDYVYSGTSSSTSHISKNIDISTFQVCLIYLWRNNRAKFESIMSDMVESRSRSISNEFLSQLKGYSEEVNTQDQLANKQNTKSRSKTASRLFLSSYDTVRFISDTLAYIHSLLVNEMENARSFFTFDFESDNNDNKELESMIGGVVTSIVKGLNNPLKGSIENVLRQESKPSTLVNSYELIDLYSSMYHKLLYPKNDVEDVPGDSLMNTMNFLMSETQDRIFFVIKLKLKNLEVELSDQDINTLEDSDVIPNWILEWCSFVDELFGPLSSKFSFNDEEQHIVGLSDEKWNDLVNLLIEKPTQLVEDTKRKSKVDKKEILIWSLNCLDYFFNKMDINPFLSKKASYIHQQIDKTTKTLTDLEFTGLLKSSGLFDIYNLVNMIFSLDDEFFDVSFYQPILENKLFNSNTFLNANQKLEEFLSGYINQNELGSLMSPALFNKVFFDSSMRFIDFYKKLALIVQEYLRDSENNAIKVFQWDDMTIATLLGIEDYYQEQQQ